MRKIPLSCLHLCRRKRAQLHWLPYRNLKPPMGVQVDAKTLRPYCQVYRTNRLNIHRYEGRFKVLHVLPPPRFQHYIYGGRGSALWLNLSIPLYWDNFIKNHVILFTNTRENILAAMSWSHLSQCGLISRNTDLCLLTQHLRMQRKLHVHLLSMT